VPPSPGDAASENFRICVVGSGTAFISGISYYTYFLTQALSSRFPVSVVLMRRLIPKFFYPGRKRVGSRITSFDTANHAPTFDGVDWTGRGARRAAQFLRLQRADIVIFQWWTGAVLPWYLLLAHAARRSGAHVIVEFHEDLDPGEAALPLVTRFVTWGITRLVALSSGFVVHSEWDRHRLEQWLSLDPEQVAVIRHGPYPIGTRPPPGSSIPTYALPDFTPVEPSASDETVLLYFGTVRPYKGVEHLIEAFDLLPRTAGHRWTLLVVGEKWEGWDAPFHRIEASIHRSDIEVVDRYIADAEIQTFFKRAHIVVLPYLRSSASGPLALSMAHGLPVVVSAVGGLPFAAEGYAGAVLVPPADPRALAAGIVKASGLKGGPFLDPHSWDETCALYKSLIFDVMSRSSKAPTPATPPAGSEGRPPAGAHPGGPSSPRVARMSPRRRRNLGRWWDARSERIHRTVATFADGERDLHSNAALSHGDAILALAPDPNAKLC
jgi:glycosyltransferase involved in cell wall biosynthesis